MFFKKNKKNNLNDPLYQLHSSYSQSGEDIIIDFVFKNYLNITNPTYLDIGANHPVFLNNTYKFYKQGCKGVLVEPDLKLYEELKKERPNDICLNIGIGETDAENTEFYIMSVPALNTFSSEEALKYQNCSGYKIENILYLKLQNINNTIKDNFKSCPDFISIDVEGMDLQILKSFNFELYRPKIFCIETLNYDKDRTKQFKTINIIEYMKTQGYFVYADTFINTIFIDEKIWNYKN